MKHLWVLAVLVAGCAAMDPAQIRAQRLAHLEETCLGYGIARTMPEWPQCMQYADAQLQQLEAQKQAAGMAMLGLSAGMMQAAQPAPMPPPRMPVTCTTWAGGDMTGCY